ncbi:MAG: sigma factor, partial [Candidatus Acidiferrales bacterium]
MDMIGGTVSFGFRFLNMRGAAGLGDSTAYWEGRVAVDSDVARLRGGDLDALSTLLTRYQNRLYRYLLRLVREPAEAEDLFQQTW